MKILKRAAYVAFPHSLPILAGYGFLGLTYGICMSVNGLHPLYTFFMSLFLYGGSTQIVGVSLLTAAFDPVNAFIITFILCARHIFYGISMLENYKGLGIKKIYMIFGMVDETFSINFSAQPPADVDRGWFMFFVTLFNQIYWIIGSTVGAVFGTMINFSTEGIEFVMTSMFVVIFVEQWKKDKNHFSALIGLGVSLISLLIFGADNFIIPSMIGIFSVLTLSKKHLERKVGDAE
ncbi:MAG: AzlC family ABC transporter permease [Clostridia bacterium]|nr:AzlC family ABC transporter permease [Clostridia bacterium]